MKLATTLILVSAANSAMALSWSNFASIFTGGRAAVGSTPSNTTASTSSSSSSQGAQTCVDDAKALLAVYSSCKIDIQAAASSSASFVPTLDQATCICSPPNQQSLLKVVSSCISPSDKDTAAVASALQSGCAQLSASLVVSQNSPCNLNGDFACGTDNQSLFQCGYVAGNTLAWRPHSTCGPNTICSNNGQFVGCINAPSSSSSSSTQQPNNPSTSNSNSNPSKGIDSLTPPTGPCQTFGKFQCSKADNLSLYQCAYTSTTQLSWVWQSKCLPSQYCVDNGPNGYVGCMNKDQGSMGPNQASSGSRVMKVSGTGDYTGPDQQQDTGKVPFSVVYAAANRAAALVNGLPATGPSGPSGPSTGSTNGPTNNGPVNNAPSGQFWNNAPTQNNGPISNSCTYGDWKCAGDAKTILICSYVAGNSLAWIEQSKCPGQCLVKGGYVGCV
ncbi:hypothetical protein HDU99_002895 [Rhizoclosmatium hyalinum]|nr:hypothetical protein HDU99_002895 [Rhizoclosmatium hyalinum]